MEKRWRLQKEKMNKWRWRREERRRGDEGKSYGPSWPVWRRRRKKRHRKTAPNLIVTSIHFAFHQSSSCKVSSTLSFVKFYVFICEYVHFFYSHLQHIIRKVNWKKNKNIKLRESNQKREGYQQFPLYIHMHTRKEEEEKNDKKQITKEIGGENLLCWKISKTPTKNNNNNKKKHKKGNKNEK